MDNKKRFEDSVRRELNSRGWNPDRDKEDPRFVAALRQAESRALKAMESEDVEREQKSFRQEQDAMLRESDIAQKQAQADQMLQEENARREKYGIPQIERGPDSLKNPQKSLIPTVPVPGAGSILPGDSYKKNLPPGKSESSGRTKVDFKSDTKTKPFDLGITPDIETVDPKIGEEKKKAVYDYIKEKYGFGADLDDAAIKAAQEKANELQDKTSVWQLVSGIGGAISGRGTDQTNAYFDKLRNRIQDKEVGDIERRRKAKVEALGLAQALNKFGSEEEQRDPQSNVSLTLRNTYKKLFPDIANKLPNFESLSAYDIATNLADPIKLLQRDKETKMEYDIKKQEIASRGLEQKAAKAAKAAKLSDKQINQVTDFDNALSAISEIEAEKKNHDTGPVSAGQSWLAQKFGMDDSKKSAFKAMVQDQLAQYIKGISGAAVSEKERAFLLQNLPSMADNDETFSSKLNVVKRRLETNRTNYINNLSKSGKDVGEFEQAPTRQPPQDDKVKIKLPDGRTGTIPKANLEKALKQGAKVIE